MKRLLESTGYEILEIRSIPAPYPLAIGDNIMSRFLLTINQLLNVLFRGLFAYQMAFVVRPQPMIEHLLENAHLASQQRLEERAFGNTSEVSGAKTTKK
jgi:hypothetical protein